MKYSKVKPLEGIFVIMALVAYTGALVRLFVTRSYGLVEVNENNIYMQGFFVITYLVAIIYLFSKPQTFFVALQKIPAVWLLVLWALCSVLWSYAPDITLRRAVALIGTTIFAMYLATRFSPQQNFNFLGAAFAIVMIASYICALLFPTDDAWTGVFFTKNELTRASLLASMIFVFLLQTTKRKIWGGFLLAALLLLFKSSSATGIALLIISLGMIAIFFILNSSDRNKKVKIVILAVLLAILVTGTLLLYWNDVLTYFQKDVTLTGRIPLWKLVWVAIQKHPIFGYGYGGFWNGWDGPSAAIWSVLLWLPPGAHNGFLDLTLDLGIIGVGIYVTVLISFIYRAANNNQRSTSFDLFLFLFIVFMLIYNLFENIALSRNSIFWLVTVMLFLQSSISTRIQSAYANVSK